MDPTNLIGLLQTSLVVSFLAKLLNSLVSGDFAGGALNCAFGICAALIKRQRTGHGSIVDMSMTEGVAYLASYIFAYQDRDQFWNPEYGFFSGRCPIFRTYETKDGKFMSCGALEPKFHNEVFRGKFVHFSSSMLKTPKESKRQFISTDHMLSLVPSVASLHIIGFRRHLRNVFCRRSYCPDQNGHLERTSIVRKCT